MLVAHEMTHALDNTGIKFDEIGHGGSQVSEDGDRFMKAWGDSRLHVLGN